MAGSSREDRELDDDVFAEGVMRLHETIDPDMPLEEEAARLLSVRLKRCAEKIANKISVRSNTCAPADLAHALQEVLGDTVVLKCAHGEGCRCLTLHVNGLLPFEPAKTRKEADRALALSQGFAAVLGDFDPPAPPLEAETQRFLEITLLALADQIASRAAAQSGSGECGDAAVSAAVSVLLPDVLRRHAVGYAVTCVADFARGDLRFESEYVRRKKDLTAEASCDMLRMAEAAFATMQKQVCPEEDARQAIRRHVGSVCSRIINSAVAAADGSELTPATIRAALLEVLPGQLATLAISNATTHMGVASALREP